MPSLGLDKPVKKDLLSTRTLMLSKLIRVFPSQTCFKIFLNVMQYVPSWYPRCFVVDASHSVFCSIIQKPEKLYISVGPPVIFEKVAKIGVGVHIWLLQVSKLTHH